MLFLLQLFGCVDWAPSDLITAFLLAGAAQSARRRVQVSAIVAAGGPGTAPSPERKPTGTPSARTLHLQSLGIESPPARLGHCQVTERLKYVRFIMMCHAH